MSQESAMMNAQVCAPILLAEFSICNKLEEPKSLPEQDSAFQKKTGKFLL